ncbi:unnamed protein product [Spirodela intermedia]|uniref:Uncharacterized protein n=1 Tax=Spirodela intermedia TaxID=51605 RepID=A0ABN7EA48_SPIIN|nr:unnamed protein product [Spirodela intermedia]
MTSSCRVHGLRGSPWIRTIGLSNHLRRLSLGGAENGDFAALRQLSPDGEELDGGGRVLGSFILRSAQQEEALHRIWYALRSGSEA